MSHGVGVVAAVQELLGPLVVLFALVTQLGDAWFLLLVLSLLYFSGGELPGVSLPLDRREVAYVFALALGALGLTVGLKLLVGLPRPPGAGVPPGGEWLPTPLFEGYASAASADGYGFPSGHALGTTVVYGALALVYGDGVSRRRLLVAAGLAGLVGFSRIAIGVHHLSSVLGGFLIGGLYLAAVTRLTTNGERVELAFLAAGLAGVFGLIAGGITHDPVVVAGLAVGGGLTWHLVGEQVGTVSLSTASTRLVVVGGLTIVGGLFLAIELVAGLVSGFLLAAVLMSTLLALPVVAAKKNGSFGV